MTRYMTTEAKPLSSVPPVLTLTLRQEGERETLAWSVHNVNDKGMGALNGVVEVERSSSDAVDEDRASVHGFLKSLDVIVKEDGLVATSQSNLFELNKWMHQRFSAKVCSEKWEPCRKIRDANREASLRELIDPGHFAECSLEQFHNKIFAASESNIDTSEERYKRTHSNVLEEHKLVAESVGWFLEHKNTEILGLAVTKSGPRGLYRSRPGHGGCNFGAKQRRGGTGDSWNKLDSETDVLAIDPLENVKFVVVDVETHDWVPNVQPSRSIAFSKVVEIAWRSFDADGSELDSKCYLLKPSREHYEKIALKAEKYHGITTKCASEKGTDHTLVFQSFMKTLKKIPDDGFVIAHNMSFEDAILYTNLDQEQRVIWDRMPKCCTMNPSLSSYLPRDSFSNHEFPGS